MGGMWYRANVRAERDFLVLLELLVTFTLQHNFTQRTWLINAFRSGPSFMASPSLDLFSELLIYVRESGC